MLPLGPEDVGKAHIVITQRVSQYYHLQCQRGASQSRGNDVTAIDVVSSIPSRSSRALGAVNHVFEATTYPAGRIADSVTLRHKRFGLGCAAEQLSRFDERTIRRIALAEKCDPIVREWADTAQCSTWLPMAVNNGFCCPAAAVLMKPSLISHWMTPPRPVDLT